MNILFGPEDAARLAEAAAKVAGAAREIALFGEMDPDLAGECGVEVCALEARTILSGGAPARVLGWASESLRMRRPMTVPEADVGALRRLEEVVALGSSRIRLRLAAFEAESAQEGLARIGGILGLASSAYGLLKSVL